MKTNYVKFQKGLRNGLAELWQPWFMSGVRNGGFEQTLRNVCIPHIEAATGRMAFTESGQRADLLLCGPEGTQQTRTRCEFKVNFAHQHAVVKGRITKAEKQVKLVPSVSAMSAHDGVVIYAIAELVLLKGKGDVQRHNAHVQGTPYKQFYPETESACFMQSVEECFEGFDRISDLAPPLKLRDGSGSANLHVWTKLIRL